MKKAISILFILAFALGVVGPIRAENRLVPPGGISQGTADAIYVNESGDTMTGVLLMPDGISSDPSIGFASESGTGWFLTKALRQAWTIEGTGTVVTLNSSTFAVGIDLTVDGDTTLGDVIGDAVTVNAGTWNILSLLTANFSSDYVLNVGANTMTINAVTGGLEINAPIVFDGTFELKGTDGIEFSPGVGVDAPLLVLQLPGGPTLWWRTATTSFELDEILRVTGLGVGVVPGATAAFQVSSTTQGSIPSPPMTSAQRDAIAGGSPPESLTVYDTTNNVWNFYNGTSWRAVLHVAASSLVTGCVPFADSASSLTDDADFFWDNTDKQLGIGTNTPNNSARLDVTSTTAGSLPVPRMTTAQRGAIGTPAPGLQVDDSDLNALTRYNGSGFDVFSVNVPTIKAGVEAPGSFAGNPLTATVTFGTAFPDANYSVSVSGADVRDFTVESQAAGSFDINANAAQALSSSVYWTAIAHYDP